jgi:PAS domain S-box-containing protein
MDLRTDEDFARLLLASHERVTGRPLIDRDAGEQASAQYLYAEAPFCLLAHDGAADPRFVYANHAAQSRFGYGWDEFVGLPSRLSAEAPEREERQRLLDAVARDGFIGDYRGIRIAKSGQRFWIENATVWELVDAAGTRRGQAAMFRQTKDL